jgi:hypothetical protein
VLEHDRLHHVRYVLQAVERALHGLDDVFPAEHVEGLELAGEQAGQGAAMHGVAFALELVDGVEVRLHALHGLEAGDELLGLLGALHHQVGLLAELGQRGRDAGELHAVRDLEQVVDHVVELLGQSVDVLAVERRHERGVEPLQDRAHHLVTLVLAGGDLLVQRRVGRAVEQVAQPSGAIDDIGGRLVEQREEGVVGGNETEAHGLRFRRRGRGHVRPCAQRGLPAFVEPGRNGGQESVGQDDVGVLIKATCSSRSSPP